MKGLGSRRSVIVSLTIRLARRTVERNGNQTLPAPWRSYKMFHRTRERMPAQPPSLTSHLPSRHSTTMCSMTEPGGPRNVEASRDAGPRRHAVSRVTFLITTVGVLTLVIGLGSCAGTPPLAVQNEVLQQYRGEHFDLTLRFIDEDELIDRYGRRDNLFIAPVGLISRDRFIPFELKITARREAVALPLNLIEMSYGGRSVTPMNQFHFGQYWQHRDEQSEISGAEAAARQRTIRRAILPNTTRVAPGETESGMLLFRGNFPRYGTAEITVQIVDQTDRPIERAQFRYEF